MTLGDQTQYHHQTLPVRWAIRFFIDFLLWQVFFVFLQLPLCNDPASFLYTEHIPYTNVRCKYFFKKNMAKYGEFVMSERNSRLMSIGEVAKSLHITRRMILNYEDKGILLPDVKTGSGGNRLLYPGDPDPHPGHPRLQTLGISLDEIKLYFEDAADLRDIIARLEKLRDELNLCIEKLQLRVRENSNDAPSSALSPPRRCTSTAAPPLRWRTAWRSSGT